ncbi:MAG: class D sortase [Acidobacteria bacterium]|nr:MAG: class D sortase [Acidobacteriota bacterium]
MKFRIRWQMLFLPRTRSFLGWTGHLFLVIGILTLGYVGFALLDAKLYQAYETWRFHQALKGMGPSVGSGESLHLPPLPPSLTEVSHRRPQSLGMAASVGSPLGLIEISAIGLEVLVLEGTDDGVLRRAVGHIPGTSLLGQQGNVAIAGHRDTFFRPLRKIRKNDEITLTTLDGSYRYRVDSTQVVAPEDTRVLADSDEAILTLVTCYPFYFVGSAPKRFIVRAHRVPLAP